MQDEGGDGRPLCLCLHSPREISNRIDVAQGVAVDLVGVFVTLFEGVGGGGGLEGASSQSL